MEFWGVEVKGGEPILCQPGEGYLVHLSQACLGERKKDKENESVCIYAKIGDKKLVIGTLSHDKFPQLFLDLVFEKDFELSHTGKHGSVHFTGYKVMQQDETDDSEDESEDDALFGANLEKPVPNAATVMKADAKQKGKVIDNQDSDESDDDDAPLTNGEDDDEETDDEDDESDDEDEDSDEDEETPKKVEPGTKRPAESAAKTPADKKAKFVSPQKTDGKKGGVHVATPYPIKKTEKKPSSSDQKKETTPKSFACTTCNRSFGSENALQSHTKAKHTSA